MKRITTLFLSVFFLSQCVLSAFFLSQCGSLDELTKFDIDYNTSIVISSSVGVNTPFDVTTSDIVTYSASEFADHDTRVDQVESITLGSLTLMVTSPQNASFDFLNTIEVYINADGLNEKKVAWKDNISDNVGDILQLTTSGDDLKEYIKNDSFGLRVKTMTDKQIPEDYTIEVQSVFRVDAKILGI